MLNKATFANSRPNPVHAETQLFAFLLLQFKANFFTTAGGWFYLNKTYGVNDALVLREIGFLLKNLPIDFLLFLHVESSYFFQLFKC